MATAISRYGSRVIPTTQQIMAGLERRGELLEGPHVAAFEAAFSRRVEGRSAISTSYGRMAFYYLLKALAFPAGSEIVFPALTFWVVPEIARVLGAGEDVRLAITENQFLLEMPNFVMAARLIEGQFPNYEAVIPKEHPGRMTVGRAAIGAALRRVAVMAEDRNKPVKLTLEDGRKLAFKRRGLKITLMIGDRSGEGLLRRLEHGPDVKEMLRAALEDAARNAGASLAIGDEGCSLELPATSEGA